MNNNQIIRNCNKCQKPIELGKEIYSNPENLWWHLSYLKKENKPEITSEKIKSEVETGKSLLLKIIKESIKTK